VAEIDLYTRTPELRPAFAVLAKSLLMRVQVVRTESRWLAARVSLARARAAVSPERAGAVGEAERVARQLDREKTPVCHVWALRLRAGVSSLGEDAGAAAVLLRTAASAADENDMGLCAAVARRRLGVLLRGDEGAALVAQADEWMRGEGIVNPSRMADVIAPGFAAELS